MPNALIEAHPVEVHPDGQTAIRFDSAPAQWSQVLLVEDDSGRANRRPVPGIDASAGTEITIRLHRIEDERPQLVASRSYSAGTLESVEGRAAVALELLDATGPHQEGCLVAAGTTYGANQRWLSGLQERGLRFAVELPPSVLVQPAADTHWGDADDTRQLTDLLQFAVWRKVTVVHPTTKQKLDFLAADFGEVRRQDACGRLVVIQTGEVKRLQRGTIFALVSSELTDTANLVPAIGWTRWIRPYVRRLERTARFGPTDDAERGEPAGTSTRLSAEVPVRVNITIARQQDAAADIRRFELGGGALRGRLAEGRPALNVAELFAGAGGMGLGFLLAGEGGTRYRVAFSGEVHPIYVQTLRRNHEVFAALRRCPVTDAVPESLEALDLRSAEALERADSAARAIGGIDVLIGGPPCQGFSSANRNSWHSSNPHNQLVDVFLSYVEKLKPRAFLMENVQGIVWTPKHGEAGGRLSVADDFTRRTREAGYLVFPKLLDAVWYGVPQHRNRFFILGVASDLGYSAEEFGSWGPFPRPTHGPAGQLPYVTAREAMIDLPSIWNGYSQTETAYEEPCGEVIERNPFLQMMREGAPDGVILDHVTSRHAGYVIERYLHIPPGGNWEDIAHLLTNYAAIERTHSNIYRRLVWDEPSITIGHYRKSMLVHPSQHRGLSLREACRLQSFPDWFRFVGTKDGSEGGLTHKQQQLANAVCPLVTKTIAEFIARL